MIVTLDQVGALALACVLLIAVPGPSVLFVVGRALSYGRGTALASVAGNSAGCYLAAVCVALGLGPVLQQSDLLFQVVKLAGAGYLVWLGVQAFRHARPLTPGSAAAGVAPSPWRSVRAGVLVGVSNPKVFIIFAAVLPQFVDNHAGHVPAQMLQLALVPVLIGLVLDSAWAGAAGNARDWLASSPRRTTAIGRAGGLSMIGLGISMATTGRDD